jgi:hypothetical protein
VQDLQSAHYYWKTCVSIPRVSHDKDVLRRRGSAEDSLGDPRHGVSQLMG